MAVGRSHTFTLDEAALSGGAAIVAAGSGLPRRITGGIDYEARVLALNPSGYWPLDEASGNFLDRTANARPLTPNTGYARGVVGSGVGGSSTAALWDNGAGSTAAAGIYAEHTFSAASPWSVLVWIRYVPASPRVSTEGNFYIWRTQSGIADASAGVSVVAANLFPYVAIWFGDGAGKSRQLAADLFGIKHLWDGAWHGVVVTYNGLGAFSAANYAIWCDGVAGVVTALGGTATSYGAAPSAVARAASIQSAITHQRAQHVAVWSNRLLSSSEAVALTSIVPCGTARWTLPAASAERTLKGFQLPGRLARNDATRLGVRARYDVGGGEVEFDPGDDLSVTIPAGQSVSLIADLTHYHLEDLPYIADSLGGGPVALYEEPDPVIEVNITGIHSSNGNIQLELNFNVASTVQPTKDPLPATPLTTATINANLLNIGTDPSYPLRPTILPTEDDAEYVAPPDSPIGSSENLDDKPPDPPIGEGERIS